MSVKKLLLLMGTERSGVYSLVPALSNMNVPCGFPYASLRNPLAVRHMPPHPLLWYWSGIRRIFEELGLPAIAEPPLDRISPEEREIFIRTLARCLKQHLISGSFLCGDHLTSLVLPFVSAAVAQNKAQSVGYLFFTHPAREIAVLKREKGQPAALTEFLWRNTIAAALRHCGQDLRIVHADSLDSAGWRELCREICRELDFDETKVAAQVMLASVPGLPPEELVSLSPLTHRLYSSLLQYAGKEIDYMQLQAVANEIHSAQAQQAGWQYVDCLDCGELHPHARNILAQMETAEKSDAPLPLLPENQQEWFELLEAMEYKLMEARQEFDTKLFMHSDNLHRHYMHLLEDERKMFALSLRQEKEKDRLRRRRGMSRIRALVQKLLSQRG